MTAEKVLQLGILKDPAYLYFVDKQGDISRAKLNRKGNITEKGKKFLSTKEQTI